MKRMCRSSSILLFGFVWPFLAVPLTWAQTSAVPQVYGVYGGTIGSIVAMPVPGETNKSRLFVTTDSANSVYYTDLDHSLTDFYATNNYSFRVVPDMDGNANHGTPWWLDVHQPSMRMFAACDDGLFGCTIASNSVTTNITSQMAYVYIRGDYLFAVSGGVDEEPKTLYYGTLNSSGALTLGASISTTFNGTAIVSVNPANSKLYVLENVVTNFTLYKSSSDYDAFSAATTFAPVSVPTGLSWVAANFTVGPDGRLFLGGVSSNLQIAYSDDDGTNWTTVDAGSGIVGGGIGLNIECNGSSNAYEVYCGCGASSNKGETGTWTSFPRGGQSIPPFSHANAGCVEADSVNSQVIYFTTDKGMGSSTNLGVDCFELNQGLTAVQINDMDMSASKDIAWLASKAGIRRATNFRTSPVWTDGEFPNAIVNCVAMETSDTNGLTAYAGSGARIYKTTTGGGTDPSSWTTLFSINQNDPGVTNGITGTCKVIKVDGSNIYAGFAGEEQVPCEGRFYMTPDSGSNWTLVATNIDVVDIVVNTESSVKVVYVAVMKAELPSGGGSEGGIYRYVPGVGITRDLTNSVDINSLTLDSIGGIYACGAESNTAEEPDQSLFHVALFYRAPGSTTWTALTRSGLPVDFAHSDITGSDKGPVMTVGKDSATNDVPLLAAVRTLYCLPQGSTNWSSLYTYPNGTQIKMLYWDELLVGTTIGLYGQAITVASATTTVVADFDGDGKSDVAVYHEATGYWFILLSSTLTLSYEKLGETGYTPVPADYDGDGKADMAVFHEASGYWYYILSSTYALGYSKLGESGYAPVPADYDGDGKADLAVFNETTGWWYYILSSTYALGYTKLGETGYAPVPADYDGDAKADLAVYNETTGWWYYILSSSGSLGYTKLGESGYAPVPADYDGDGKADLAVYNETTGWWYYVLSSSGSLGYSKLGASGYVPVPGDYDGDGKTDLTVYQEASGYWYHILSTTYALSYEKLGEPGYTPVK